METHDSRWCAADAPCLSGSLADTSFAVVDLETTGSIIGVDRIMQIGLAVTRGGQIVERFSSLVSVDRTVPPWVARLTGLSNADLEGQPSFDDLAPRLAELLEGCVFVAHDVRFDLPFLRWEYLRRNLSLPPLIALCTLKLSGVFWPELPSRSLANLADHFGLSHLHPHRADDDAAAAAGVLLEILSDADAAGVETLGELLAHTGVEAASSADGGALAAEAVD